MQDPAEMVAHVREMERETAARRTFRALMEDVQGVERRLGLQGALFCRASIEQNAGTSPDKPTYFQDMLGAAGSTIGLMAEDHSLDINAELGRVIY